MAESQATWSSEISLFSLRIFSGGLTTGLMLRTEPVRMRNTRDLPHVQKACWTNVGTVTLSTTVGPVGNRCVHACVGKIGQKVFLIAKSNLLKWKYS